jgi:hypothetical protein
MQAKTDCSVIEKVRGKQPRSTSNQPAFKVLRRYGRDTDGKGTGHCPCHGTIHGITKSAAAGSKGRVHLAERLFECRLLAQCIANPVIDDRLIRDLSR